MNFSFAHPYYLFTLFAIPIIFFIHFLALSNKKKKALKFANFDAIAKIQGIDFFSKNVVILVMYVLIVVMITFAISGLTLHTKMESSSFSFVIAIDTSQSMNADDFEPTRLGAAKKVISNFIDNAPRETKIGLISFAGSTKIESDLTNRKDDLFLSIGDIGISSYGGTDLYEAVLTSANILKFEEHKALILLSDGQINVGNVEDAYDYANHRDMIVHTIGIGTIEGGSTGFSFSKLDENSLKTLSYNTDGIYILAGDKDNLTRAFDQIYARTDKKVAIELSDYLMLSALVLLVLVFFLSNTRYLNLP